MIILPIHLPTKLASAVIGVIALSTIAVAFPSQVNANEESDCPDPLEGIELSDRQLAQLWQLEEELDTRIEDVMPLSDEQETAIEALEERFEAEVAALLSAQQKQQLEKLDAWADEQLMAIAPEWFIDEDEPDPEAEPELDTESELDAESELDTEPELTPEQVGKLETLEEDYDRQFQAILTTEQQQTIEQLEGDLDEAIESTLPEPTTEQQQSIEAAEVEFEEQVTALLTPEQRHKAEANLACEWLDAE